MSRTRDVFWFILPLSGLFAPFALLAYYAFRIYCIVTTGKRTNHHVGLAWFFVVIEFLQLVPTILLYFKAALVPRRPRRPRMLFTDIDAPGVEILIPACGEDNDTIVNTVRAACETDWPTDRMRIIVLDDGKAEDLRKSIELLQTTYKNVYYASRDKPEVPDYKPGNLNYGLRYSDSLFDERFPFVTSVDMDMILKPCWLRTMIPHLLKDPKLGQVCPPQYFYNVPDNDWLRQDTDHYYAMVELINDGLGACNCLGSAYIMRREALDDIGGWPTFSAGDDTAISTRLTGNGWGMAYIDEVLQCGKLPDTMMGHVIQRCRWTVGNAHLALTTNFRLWGPPVLNCTPRQRVGGFVSGVYSTTNVTLAWLGFIGPPLALLSGYPLVVYCNSWQLSWLLRLVSIWIFLDWIHKAAFAFHTAYKDGLRYDQADSWLVPCMTLLIRTK
ncbi:MAG: hypothetical protein M1812_005828 [Candelaria pacifica]|nr:MAG: hypothetical protein M1812_005828 [Candelaria pacifica]